MTSQRHAAVSLDLGYKTIDPEVERNTRAAADVFRDLGCVVEDVALGRHSGVRWMPS